jgi:signal transduction histidine kinase
VQLVEKNDDILLSIRDDGVGFDMNSIDVNKKGFGLFSIAQRVNELRGKLDIDSAPGRGVGITITIKAQQ